jgi:hypothetical protein
VGSRKRGRLPECGGPAPVARHRAGAGAAGGARHARRETKGLKALGLQQRGDEIGAEGERDDEAEDGIEHGSSSQPVEDAGIEDKNEQSPYAQRHISKIKHGKLLRGWA